MAFLPSGSIPYQQYILDDAPSMASLLREAGYRTLAFHPGERTSWQRDRAYPRLGFDQFKCGEDMDVPQSMEHGYVSDRSDFEQIIWEFEHKAEGEPLFLFNDHPEPRQLYRGGLPHSGAADGRAGEISHGGAVPDPGQ